MTPVEAWLRGPVAGVPPLLQPIAHALIQARDEVSAIAATIPDDLLWVCPAGAASAGFHLQHLTGVVDRLFTYARGEQLTSAQQAALDAEGTPPTSPCNAATLSHLFDAQVESALAQLRATPVGELTSACVVGRRKLPSTVIGLLMHAAEHTTRHVGQLLVTARVVAVQATP